MIDRFIAMLGGKGARFEDDTKPEVDDLHAAAAALLVEAAGLDGTVDEAEKATIGSALQRNFDLDAAAAEALVEDSLRTAGASVQLLGFTRVVKDRLEPEDRVRVIEMLWEVAYADGELHDYEANLVRRVAGLLYVPDRDSGEARKRVLARLGPAGG